MFIFNVNSPPSDMDDVSGFHSFALGELLGVLIVEPLLPIPHLPLGLPLHVSEMEPNILPKCQLDTLYKYTCRHEYLC